MKKGLLVLLLVLALVVLISPGIIGRLAEQGVNNSLEWAANEQGEVIVTSTGFKRGWFTSAGQHRVELIRGELYDSAATTFAAVSSGPLPALLIDTRLDHGVIPVSSMTRENGTLLPGLGSAVSTLSLEMGDGSVYPLPGTIFSNVGLSGVVESRFVLQPEGTDTENARIDWGGAEFLLTLDPTSGRIAVLGALNSVAVESDDQTVIVGKVDVDINLVNSGFGFMVGPASITMESFAVIGAMDTMTAGPLHFESDSLIEDGRLDADIVFRLDNSPTPMGGSGGMHLVARLENIDAAALGRFSRSLDAARNSAFDDMTSHALQQDAMQMLAGGLKIHFDQLDFNGPFGQITSRMSASVDRSDADDYTWATALMALDATADISVPQMLVDIATANNPDMHAAIGMGFLRKQGEFYIMEAAFKQGLLTVNGAPMPIPLSGLQ